MLMPHLGHATGARTNKAIGVDSKAIFDPDVLVVAAAVFDAAGAVVHTVCDIDPNES